MYHLEFWDRNITVMPRLFAGENAHGLSFDLCFCTASCRFTNSYSVFVKNSTTFWAGQNVRVIPFCGEIAQTVEIA